MSSYAGTNYWLNIVEKQLDEQIRQTGGNDQAIIYVKICDLKVILQLARKALPPEPLGFYEKITVKPKIHVPTPLMPTEPRKENSPYINDIVVLKGPDDDQ